MRISDWSSDVCSSDLPHDAVHREEVRGVLQLLDQSQLVLERCPNTVRHAFGIAFGGALPCQFGQRLLGRERRVVALLRILIGQLIQRETAALDDLKGSGERFGIRSEENTSELQSQMRIAYAV